MDVEEKLAAYRARKIKEKEAENSLFNRLKRSFSSHGSKTASSPNGPSKNKKSSSCDNINDKKSLEENDDSIDVLENQSGLIYWSLTFLKFIFWLCVWGIFIEIQFGAVYFTLSLIVFIYFNTRSGKKVKGPSAYSVFNKDCERIQGTLTAEQMQQNMFRVPGMVS